LSIIFLHPDNIDKEVVCGSENPRQGWVSSRYNKKEPAPVLIYKNETNGSAVYDYILFPFDMLADEKKPFLEVNRKEGNRDDLRSYSITHGPNLIEYFVLTDAEGSKISLHGIDSDCDFLFISEDLLEDLKDIFAFNLTYLVKDGIDLCSRFKERNHVEIIGLKGEK